MKITVAQYILDFLSDNGIKHVYGITGGAIAFVIDSFHGRDDIKYIPVMHEQAAAMMADAYARVHESGLGATMVTSGPGATNLLTGIACSYFDSIPTIHITGQVNTFDQGHKVGIRQIGFQETNIVDMAKPITKLSEQLNRAEDIKFLLEKALWTAKEGRPGPVLLDIPQNLQREKIDPKWLRGFKPPAKKRSTLKKDVKMMQAMLKRSTRPLVLVGGGVRVAKAEKLIKEFLFINSLPFVTSWSACDMFKANNPYYIGNIGVYGNRGANFALQNCDLLIVIGSRLDTRQIGSKPEEIAPNAEKVVVDVDYNELHKGRGLEIDLPINADCYDFLEESLKLKYTTDMELWWYHRCFQWKDKYPLVDPKYYEQKDTANAYVFNRALSEQLPSDSYVFPDDGGNLVWCMQGFKLNGQRLISAFGNSPMGYAFPASIGASIALDKPVICIDGDGSIQINIQELQTVVSRNLPVKIFIMNNNGYGIIKQFQKTWLGSRFEATGTSTGVTRPDFIAVAKAYGLKTFSIKNNSQIKSVIKKVLTHDGPVLCDVTLDEFQPLIPKLDYGDTLHDMTPKLSRQEIKENIL